jgi:signal transduction histidine kinase
MFPHAVVVRALYMVTPQADAKSLSVKHGPCDENAAAWADEARVEQIVINLLSNAVKFTPAGGRISVTCSLSGDHVHIRVIDSGPGIPAEKIKAIFEPFVQLGRSLTSTHEGTGLGLAISRNLARAMRGDVQVESTFGEGATFTVTLPVPNAPER